MIDQNKLRRALLKLRAIDHPIREKIMEYIHEKGTATRTDLYIFIRVLDETHISQHLSILRRENIIVGERRGKFIDYRLNWDALEKISKASKGLAEGYHEYDDIREFANNQP